MANLIGQSLGRYHILEQLGEGGMATVYKAYDTRLETDVAVKVIRIENILPSALERTLKRFEREAKALARLTHPNIVKVMDYGEHDGQPFLVMPLLSGGTLKSKLGGKSIPWQEAARTLIPIAKALAYSHKQDIIHRDIKPSNILITDEGEPMLADFGVAKLLDAEETMELTGTGVGIGTPEYMAPEQGSSKTIDHRADIYALGVVFYEMITGRKPYTADTPLAVLIKRASEPLPKPRQFVANLPQTVENVALKALAKEPKDRYQEMSDFAKALEKLIPAKPVDRKNSTPKPKVIVPPRIKEIPVRKTRAEFKLPTFLRKVAVIAGVIALGTILIVVSLPMIKSLPTALFPASTPSQTPTPELTPTPVIISKPSHTPIPLLEPTATPFTDEIIDAKGVSMRLVPAGEFTMGADEISNSVAVQDNIDISYFSYDDLKPVRQIYLGAYYMDKYEVTNAVYKLCVDSGVCVLPKITVLYDNPEYSNHPVIEVDWNNANDFCKWRGTRLPTEAEWEKAARGTDGRSYPWGEGISASRTNYGTSSTMEVGSIEGGVSPYGIYDMAGNAWEWVNDWYLASYYKASPASNPLGPETGTRKVFRGGGFDSNALSLQVFARGSENPTFRWRAGGFRCALSIQE